MFSLKFSRKAQSATFKRMPTSSEGGELWKECVRWLIDCQVLDPSHNFFTSVKGMLEFATILRDGVILCRLSNTIIPGSIPESEVKDRNLSNFSNCKNICLFLGACSSHHGLKQGELFEAAELANLTDFVKVLVTLSCLSHSEAALRRNIKPFPHRSLPNSACTQDADAVIYPAPPAEEEAIYKCLKEEADIVDLDDPIYDTSNYCHYKNLNEDGDQIYDRIVNRRDSQRKKEDHWEKFTPSSKRDYAIKEILDTEQNYVEKALNMFVNKFYSPLQKFMDPDDHNVVFMNINSLWNLHHSFLSDLRAAVFRTLGLETGDRPHSIAKNIGEVFVLHKEKFIAYGPYCMGLESSLERLSQLEKDPAMKSRILDCASTITENQFKLQDFLCVPMQRVLKYALLLSQLIKHTPIDFPDLQSLKDAKESMEDINAYINEMKRDYEMKQLVHDIQTSIPDLQMPQEMALIDYGRMLKDGEVRVAEVTGSSNGKSKPRVVFLFDKVLIICKSSRNNTYSYKSAYVMSELSPDLDNSITMGTIVGDKLGTLTRKLNGNSNHTLVLTRKVADADDSKEVKQINMAFKSLQAFQQWLTKIESAKEHVKPKEQGGHTLKYTSYPTEKAKNCSVCNKFLKGIFFQGYSCEVCHVDVHKECIKLRPCTGRRRTINVTPSNSITSLERRMTRLAPGDGVVAAVSVHSSDPAYLSFEKDDIVEVTKVHSENIFTGFVVLNPAIDGLVKVENVKRMRTHSSILDTPHMGGARIDRKASTLLPRPAPPTPVATLDYVNTEVANQSWYMGNMERPDSERKLRNTPNGTFLVRFSENRGRFVVSISYEKEVKHTVVEQDVNVYYLDEGYVFNSVVELVNYYKDHNLSESFSSLNTTLKSPYRDCKVFRVIHNFSSDEPKFLELHKGEILTLVDTIGEDRGWWKGRINNKVGFFPMAYVQEYIESDDD